MDALREIHGQAELVIPAMVEFLSGSRAGWNYSTPAMSVLRAYGPRATSAVPAIEPYLTHQDSDKQQAANAALTAIDPIEAARAVRAAEKAGK